MNRNEALSSIQSEISTLGSLMLDSKLFPQVRGILSEEMFFEPQHRLIYRAMCKVVDAGLDLDPSIIFDQLRKDDCAEKVGGPTMLVDLMESVAVPGRIHSHVRLMREAFWKRQLVVASKTADLDLGDGKKSAKEVLEDLRSASRAVTDQMLAEAKIVDLTKSVDDRRSHYERMKSFEGGIWGIPTPWKSLNDSTQGFLPGELETVIAPQGTGKSWALAMLFNHAYKAGKRPLLISMEMATESLARRFDAVHGKFNARELRRGQLDPFVEKRYLEMLEGMKNGPPLWIASGRNVRTVYDVEALIEQLQPDILFIDSIYLLKPGNSKKERWERVADAFEGVRNLVSDYGIPCVNTTQFNRKVKAGSFNATAQDAGFAYDIMQLSDIVIAQFQDQDMKRERKMLFRLLKNREGEQVDFIVNWDLDTMNFEEIDPNANGTRVQRRDVDGPPDDDHPF